MHTLTSKRAINDCQSVFQQYRQGAPLKSGRRANQFYTFDASITLAITLPQHAVVGNRGLYEMLNLGSKIQTRNETTGHTIVVPDSARFSLNSMSDYFHVSLFFCIGDFVNIPLGFNYGKINAARIKSVLIEKISVDLVNSGTTDPQLLNCLHSQMRVLAKSDSERTEVDRQIEELQATIVAAIKHKNSSFQENQIAAASELLRTMK